MGISPFSHWSGPAEPTSRYMAVQGTPVRLDAFTLHRAQQIGHCLLVELQYTDCTNYEGRKIMLYTNMTLAQFKERKIVDPHFNEIGISPVARFEPTRQGWLMGYHLANSLSLGEWVKDCK
jgi:hypothetical protein